MRKALKFMAITGAAIMATYMVARHYNPPHVLCSLAIIILSALNCFLFGRMRRWCDACGVLEAINAPRKITSRMGSMACKIYAGMRQGKDVWQCMEPIACSWIASRVEGERRPTHRRASHGKLLKAAVQEGAGFSPNAEISKPAPSISFADDEKEEKI